VQAKLATAWTIVRGPLASNAGVKRWR
jgi:hypothetical protein